MPLAAYGATDTTGANRPGSVEGSPPAEPAVLAPGWRPLSYQPPAVGSYTLPVIKQAADGQVLDSASTEHSLHALMRGRISVLSFIYTTCHDINGCPLATAVLEQVRGRLLEDRALIGHVQLLSLSFDPAHDTPEMLRMHGADPNDLLLKLTTRSQAELQPLLEGYGQVVQAEYDGSGRKLESFSHLLRVFLVDAELNIRNIYSADFLHADVLMNDIRTIRAERRSLAAAAPATRTNDEDALLARMRTPPLGLPPLPDAALRTASAERIALGRKMFFDRRLSLNNTISCAMCHVPEQGFASNELATAVGFEGRTVKRNAPTLLNVAYAPALFHDAREFTLEQQVWSPLLAANEMANPSVGAVIKRLQDLPDYAGAFESAFGHGPDMMNAGIALAAYQRALLAGDSAFDRWRFGGDQQAVGEPVKRGFKLFTGKAGCSACHLVGERDALFTDHGLHNTGVGYRQTMAPEPAMRTIELAPGVSIRVETAAIGSAAEKKPGDLGRYEITQDPADRWRYRTPGLRNVALSAPYMHDGSLRTLADVVDYYNRGGVPHELQSPLIKPLGLSTAEQSSLVAFMRSLTGSNIAQLVADARRQSIGDVGTAAAPGQ